MKSTTIGIDLAKSVFQISIADHQQRIIKRHRLSRSQFKRFIVHTPPARLVMEGCASAHHWSRVATAHGHNVTLLHAHYVRPYVRRNKTDSADADALVRASGDVDLKPIPIKSEHQQALQSLHRIRAQWQRARVASINEARSLFAEFGITMPRGAVGIAARLYDVLEQLPALLQPTLSTLIDDISRHQRRIKELDTTLARLVKEDAVGQRLLEIPGVGPTIASATLGSVSDIHQFKRGRCFSAWLGITPRENSSGNTRRLGKISKQGNRYLRTLLIHGARSALLGAKRARSRGQPLTELQAWALRTEERTCHNVATVALANKMARILWAVWTKSTSFDGNHAKRYH